MCGGVYLLNKIEQLFASLGCDFSARQKVDVNNKWLCFILNDPKLKIPILFIENGPKNIAEVKLTQRDSIACFILFKERNTIFLKSGSTSHTLILKNDSEYDKISAIIQSCDITNGIKALALTKAIKSAIRKISNATADFDNRGLFATYYLQGRMFNDVTHDITSDINSVKQNIGNAGEILRILGYDAIDPAKTYCDGKVSVVLTTQNDFSIRESEAVTPSYTAISKLQDSQWVILTNGKKWRLYSNKISASSTNYFEVVLDPARDTITKYLIALFSLKSFETINKKCDIDLFFDEGKNYAIALESDLSGKIMDKNGLFLDIVKGVLNHDMKQTFTDSELTDTKQTALKIMYRVWFIAYAESRNLLPVNDSKYQPISLQSIRTKLDSFDSNPNETDCWDAILNLFGGIRDGDKTHNLPQYNGNLFEYKKDIDNILIRNKFIVPALRALLENNGDAIDYANLGVRHLGNIFEILMEYGVKQATADIMLLENKKGEIKEVKTKQESTYSYKKNELYLASKGGIVTRKTTASFYTKDEIVKFLVKQGLDRIFADREKLIKNDLKKYEKSKSEKDLQICTDRILDIQVLDPSMGSGHFLVEALNRITQWATNILEKYPNHPLLLDIESDRKTIIKEQKKKGITIDKHILTYDVLLKRKIMKRCIFGVDINPMAVNLAKLSLWLDSFAIGVPLTYMDHHIKTGDSTIGMFLEDLKNKEMRSLDDWLPSEESNKMICDVISSSDVTVDQVYKSEDNYRKHQKSLEPHKHVLDALTTSKIDTKFLPKKGKNVFIHRFKSYSKKESDDLKQARTIVDELMKRHKFFHWEIEMMDAFTDQRRGFDLIVGNPPWEKIKPYDDEFFTPYYPAFRNLKTKTKKTSKMDAICEDPEINNAYQSYKNIIGEKNTFYKIYQMQSSGDKDLWKLVFERMLNLVGKGGIISMVIPSSILSNVGVVDMRKTLLEKDILSMYVFENKKKIFDIDSRYRFVVLSVRNSEGPDEFSAGFYLHELESLENKDKESTKFGMLSKQKLLDSVDYMIPELVGFGLEIYEKISQNDTFGDGLGNGWDVEFTSGFHQTNNANLLKEDGKGWPVHEGKTIHQYNHEWNVYNSTINEKDGLERESNKRVFLGDHKNFYDSFRLVFRRISSAGNMRTSISTIIPPHTFHTNTLRSVVLTRNGNISLDTEYDKKIAYLCGVMNSLIFDFVTRGKIQTDLATIIKSLPTPNPIHEDRIAELAGTLMVGTPEFKGFAESLRIPNIRPTPAERIALAAELDVLVALSYNLTKIEYETIIDYFPAFEKNPALYEMKSIIWDNSNLKEFYGEMADLALEYFGEVSS